MACDFVLMKFVCLCVCVCVCVVISLSLPHRRCLMNGDRYCVHLMSLCRRPSATLSSSCPPLCPQNSTIKASSKTLLQPSNEIRGLQSNYKLLVIHKVQPTSMTLGNRSICACFRLWFDELMDLWVSVQNLPAWEGVSTSHSGIHLLSAKYYVTISFLSSISSLRI